jgi:hypothetical protein
MSATTTQLLSSGEFCKLRFDTIPVKSASSNVFSIPITQKCQILSCGTLVANERNAWELGLKHGGSAASLLGLWVRIPPVAWLFVSCERCVL